MLFNRGALAKTSREQKVKYTNEHVYINLGVISHLSMRCRHTDEKHFYVQTKEKN